MPENAVPDKNGVGQLLARRLLDRGTVWHATLNGDVLEGRYLFYVSSVTYR